MPLRKLTFVIAFLFTFHLSFSQENNFRNRIGFDYIIGSQQYFPFNDPNYYHSEMGYRLQFNHLIRSGRFSYELQIEPSYYVSEHQMLNPQFIPANPSIDYEGLRKHFMQRREINEYVINIGLVTRYNFSNVFSAYLLISTGPGWVDKDTERLASGFAFSNLISAGGALTEGRFRFELGPGIRHVSNANTHFPNGGHNCTTLDCGVTFSFK